MVGLERRRMMGRRVMQLLQLQLLLVARALHLCAVRAHPDPHPMSLFPVGRVRILLSDDVVVAPNATVITSAGQAIRVDVSGVKEPLEADVVAAYAAGSDPTAVVPLAWGALAADSTRRRRYLDTGAGSVTFHLPNHRCDVVFRLLRNGTVLPATVGGAASGGPAVVVEGESPVVRSAIKARPSQGHLGLDASGRVVVQWVSGSRERQFVRYSVGGGMGGGGSGGDSGGGPTLVVPSSAAETYSAADVCGAPANSTGWLDPGWLHSATLPPSASWMAAGEAAAAGVVISYQFGSDSAGWSDVYAFHPLPPPGAPATRFLVFNDVGTTGPVLFANKCPPYCPPGFSFVDGYGANSSKLLRYLPGERADVALLLGDLSYAQGYAADWDRFGEMFERSRVFTARPLLTASGNHETDWPGAPDVDPFGGLSRDSGGECGVPLAKRYVTPARPSASAADSGGGGGGPRPSGSTSDPSNMRRRFYYSADVGAVHFLVLDSEAPTGVGSPQRAFVESDLATVDRSVTPWVVVGMHRMMWAPSTDQRPTVGDQAVMQRLRRDLGGLLSAAGVDAVFTGHEHAWSRTCPVTEDGRCDAARGTVHVLAGNAGAGFTWNFPRANASAAAAGGAAAGGGGGATSGGGGGSSRWSCIWSSIWSRIWSSSSSSKSSSSSTTTTTTTTTTGPRYAFEPWVEAGVQGVNGYLRVEATKQGMRIDSVSSEDGQVFDSVTLPPRHPRKS